MTQVQAELRTLYSIDLDVASECPPDLSCFTVRLDAEIGPKGELGADRFSFDVCTPSWISREVERVDHLWGGSRLIVDTWDFEKIRLVVRSLCERTVGQTWEEAARRLSEYARWEYAEYKPIRRE